MNASFFVTSVGRVFVNPYTILLSNPQLCNRKLVPAPKNLQAMINYSRRISDNKHK